MDGEGYQDTFDSRLGGSELGYCEFAQTASEALGTSITDDGNLSLAQALVTLKEEVVMASVKNELENLQKFKVFDYVIDDDKKKRIMKESKLLPSKIFLKGKYDANGKFTKLKARLVAGGHRQQPDSYGRTSSPTVDISHVMLSLSLVKQLKANIATVDITAAFLHADLKKQSIWSYLRISSDS
jgi:hypothetical protein